MSGGQLSQKRDARQAAVENRLYSLGAALARLEHDELRVRQAIDRSESLRDLLGPVLEDYRIVMRSIRAAQEKLARDFEDGQASLWEVD